MKVNLGCGEDYKEGYVNCDKSNKVRADKIIDIEKKLPFKDNSVDKVVAYHVLEHVNNLVELMKEIHRICKNDSIMKIRVPFYNSPGAYTDPTHVRFFSVDSFDYLDCTNNPWQVDINGKMFSSSCDIVYSTGKYIRVFNPIFNVFVNFNRFTQRIYQKFLSGVIIADEIEFDLQVMK